VIAKAANGKRSKVGYDFLINATGPALRFDKTEGLGPDGGNSLSVCLPQHAAQAAAVLDEEVERMRRGEKRRFLVGVSHGTCTCEGAAFEYIVNLEFELRHRGVRDRAEITWITNEYELGDFGMGGMHLERSGYITPSSIFNASLFAERDPPQRQTCWTSCPASEPPWSRPAAGDVAQLLVVHVATPGGCRSWGAVTSAV
jgi:sulfide:quinone oxidoreductase